VCKNNFNFRKRRSQSCQNNFVTTKKFPLNDATSNLKRTDRIEEIRQQCTVLAPARLTLLKINKNYETLGLHSLDIRLQICAINFPLSLHSEP
jgi:hypothetical protein